jgi:hypothetical protein
MIYSMMKKIIIVIGIISLFSCNSQSQITKISAEPVEIAAPPAKPEAVLISGTRQKIYPGMDDGSGSHKEKWILKLDVPRDYNPAMELVYMGYVIPVENSITYISDEEKAVLRFTVNYPLMDNYDTSDGEPNAKPILYFKTENGVETLDLSNVSIMQAVAYPTMNREGGY